MKWKNILWLIGFALVIFLLIIFCSCKEKENKATLPSPTVSKTIEKNTIGIQIDIPKDHHAYLDKGKEGNLVPIQFIWSDFKENQLISEDPKILKQTEGIFDSETGAKVLKNSGSYLFEFPIQYENNLKEKIKNRKLILRIQICNEVTGICYRPQNIEVIF